MLDAITNQCVDTHNRMCGPSNSAATPSGSRRSWYVIATYPQAERRAVQGLAEQGYPTYLPLRLVQRRDRVTPTMLHTVEVPLFPAYAFVSFDATRDPWRPITNTGGVYDLVRTAGIPAPCRCGVVEALRDGEASRRTPTTSQGPRWRPGAACRICAGAFDGHDAVVLKVRRNMALVALMMFGHLREIAVSVDCLMVRD